MQIRGADPDVHNCFLLLSLHLVKKLEIFRPLMGLICCYCRFMDCTQKAGL